MRAAYAAFLALGLLACGGTTKAPAPPVAAPGAPAPRQLYVREVYVGEPIYFADELRPLRQAVGERFARAGYSVVTLEGLDGVLARAAARACVAPGSRYGAWRVAYPDATFADPNLSCAGTPRHCVLAVMVGKEGSDLPVVWKAPVPEDATLEQLVAAAAALEPPPPAPPGPRGIYGFERKGKPVEGVRVVERKSGGAGALASHQAELDACLDERTTDQRFDVLHVEADAAGHARRCEIAPSAAPPTTAAACLCDVVSKADLGTGAAGRRFAWFVEQHAPLARAADGRLVVLTSYPSDQSDPSLRSQLPRFSRRALAACWDGAKLDADAHVTLVWTLGAAGAVTHVALAWPAGLDPAPRACVEKVLASAGFPCPSAGDAKIYADLRLTLTPK